MICLFKEGFVTMGKDTWNEEKRGKEEEGRLGKKCSMTIVGNDGL